MLNIKHIVTLCLLTLFATAFLYVHFDKMTLAQSILPISMTSFIDLSAKIRKGFERFLIIFFIYRP